ncbi:MAG: PD-(D/E)XK nuclease family protein [Chloroflexota bacterium]
MAIIKDRQSHLPVPFIFSQSSLHDYSDCERRFYLRYIAHLTWPAIESEPILENERRQMEGQFFHHLVQQYWLGLPIENLTRMANTSTLSLWWENFLNYDFHLDEYEIYPELNLTAQIGNHRLTANYDLIAIRDDKIYIFDWKTYQKRPRENLLAKTYQTRVYRTLMVQAGGYLTKNIAINPDKVEMVYWLANFPMQPILFPYNTSQSVRDWQHLDAMIDKIDTQEEFPMTADDKKCKFCPYRSYCDRGISAATFDDDYEPLLEISDLSLDQIPEIEI